MGLKIEIANFYNDRLPWSLSALFSVPSGYRAIVKTILVRSEESTEKTIDIRIRRNGKTVIISPHMLKERHTWIHESAESLLEGDIILGAAQSGAMVGCKISGALEKL